MILSFAIFASVFCKIRNNRREQHNSWDITIIAGNAIIASRVGNSLFGFSFESLVFCEWKSDGSYSLLVIKRGKTVKTVKNMVNFFERIARFWEQKRESQANHSHCSFRSRHSLVKNNESDSLTVALLWRATRAIRSQSLFFKG